MPEKETINRVKAPDWLWALLPMLLAAAMVVPVLGRDIFGGDESATLRVACANHLGPCTPAEAVRQLVSIVPDQAWGIAIAFSQWGQLVGWSEFSIRSLSWLVGPLTIAWVYRLGRELFAPAVALSASLLLSTSVLFLVYMYIARLFGPAMLFTAISIWGYWRVARFGRRPKPGAQVALLLGATGVLYSHYFSALLVPALCLFHLLFVRIDRRWWRAPFLLGLAGLLALPQVTGVLSGIAFNEVKSDLHNRALQAHEILALLVRFLGGDTLQVPDPLARLLLPAMVLLVLWSIWTRRRRHWQPDAGAYVTLVSVLLALLSLALNERLKVFAPE
ncbi:MAG: glycosyltransferase family 39 protein, partial [Anaerolineaceae bacterium]|nr:glycosyltransferase family 39 protein [Anaerolineaceae bacterium]